MKFFGFETTGNTKRFYLLGIPVYSRKKVGYKITRRFLFFRSKKINFDESLKYVFAKQNEKIKELERKLKKYADDANRKIDKGLKAYTNNKISSINRNIDRVNNVVNLLSLVGNSGSGQFAGKHILYVANDLLDAGGVETRLLKQFEYLSRQGVQCSILTRDGNYFKQLHKFKNFYLHFDAPNFTHSLEEIIKCYQIDTIEFQAKATAYFTNIDFSRLKKKAKIGLCIHGEIGWKYVDFNDFDYVFRTCPLMGHNFLEPIPRIPNWIGDCQPLWKYKGQSKALFISRLNYDEKLPTLISFIEVCKKIGCDFCIAGNMDFNSGGKGIESIISNLNKNQYLGPIDTISYLKNHVHEVLFVGGVGQVPIEAASLGIPALVCTHLADVEKSRFVTAENLDFFIEHNFVINKYTLDNDIGNIRHFIQAIDKNAFSVFNVVSHIKNKLSENKAMTDYLMVLQMERHQSQVRI